MEDVLGSSGAGFGGFASGGGSGFGPQTGAPLMAVWSVPAASRAQSDQIFLTLDMDQDGLVNGVECKQLFLQSGLTPQTLAQIWALCDIRKNGLLNAEQFALSFYLIQQKVRRGIDPPASLAPDMVPPSMRMYQTQFPVPGLTTQDSLDEDEGGDEELKKELRTLEEEIEVIRKEKLQLVEQVEARRIDIQRRQNKVQNMSREVETLHAAAKQLDVQRVEAQKRLDDLEAQKKRVQGTVSSLLQELESERQKAIAAKEELERRQSGHKSQEEDLGRKRAELQKLKQEEAGTLQKIEHQRTQLSGLEQNLQDGDARISQIEECIIKAEKFNGILKEAISQFDAALDTQDISGINPDHLHRPVSELTVHAGHIRFDPISSVVSSTPHFASVPLHDQDPFHGDDPFAKVTSGLAASDDPWSASPFGTSDPFAGGGFPPESPLPVLPPKKSPGQMPQIPQQNTGGASRQAPPRPAPPKTAAKKKDAGPAKDAFEGDPWGTNSAHDASSSYSFPAFEQPTSATFATDFDDFGKFT